MKKDWLQVASVMLNIVLLVFVLRLSDQVKGLQYDLEQDLQDVEETVSGELSCTLSEMRQTLEDSVKLHTDYGLEITGVDKETKSLLTDAFVQLKRWGADTAVTLSITQGEKVAELPMTHEGNGRFTASVALAAEEVGEICLAVSVLENGLTTQEDLGGWDSVSMLLPLQMDAWAYSGPTFAAGVLTLEEVNAFLDDGQGNYVQVQEAEFRVYQNGELVRTVAGLYDPDKGYSSAETVKLTGVKAADYVWVNFACCDTYGLHYEFPMITWSEGEPPLSFLTAMGCDKGPVLTWD